MISPIRKSDIVKVDTRKIPFESRVSSGCFSDYFKSLKPVEPIPEDKKIRKYELTEDIVRMEINSVD